MITTTDVIESVRQNLDDTVDTLQRFEDDEISKAIDRSVLRLTKDRPDVMMEETGLLNGADNLSTIDDSFVEAIECYTTYLMLRKDGEDTNNAQLALVYLQAYKDTIS